MINLGVRDSQSRTTIRALRGLDSGRHTSSVSPSGGKTQRDPFTGPQMSEMRHILRETCVAPWSQRQSGKAINKTQPLETLPKPQSAVTQPQHVSFPLLKNQMYAKIVKYFS